MLVGIGRVDRTEYGVKTGGDGRGGGQAGAGVSGCLELSVAPGLQLEAWAPTRAGAPSPVWAYGVERLRLELTASNPRSASRGSHILSRRPATRPRSWHEARTLAQLHARLSKVQSDLTSDTALLNVGSSAPPSKRCTPFETPNGAPTSPETASCRDESRHSAPPRRSSAHHRQLA
jgi:hypothetical protein